MSPNSVSRRFVWLAAVPVMLLLAVTIWAALTINVSDFAKNPSVVVILWPLLFLSQWLVRWVLSCLGISVRSRSVERFQAGPRDQKAPAADLPFAIRYNQGFVRLGAGFFGLVGLGLLVTVLWPFGVLLILMGLLFSRYQQPKICEITEEGIRIRMGFWTRLTLVSWVDLARCEIIHDDEHAWGDYFLLWDRAGRCRVDARSWIGDVSAADRAWLFRALRFRFPGKGRADSPAEPALVAAASSAVWDRELDG